MLASKAARWSGRTSIRASRIAVTTCLPADRDPSRHADRTCPHNRHALISRFLRHVASATATTLRVLPSFLEEVFHLGFQKEAVPEDEIGLCHGRNIGAGLAIGVRVNTRSHQGAHLDNVATDLAGGVGDHAGCRNDLHLVVRRQRSLASRRTPGSQRRWHRRRRTESWRRVSRENPVKHGSDNQTLVRECFCE